MSTKANGYILWESDKLVCIATNGSKNTKTGAMVQTWILLKDVDPINASRLGLDSAICGDCRYRGNNGKERGCYVMLFAPNSIYKAYKAGNYSRDWTSETFRNKSIRLGAYGDPAFVPISIWNKLLRYSKNHTGYTHQWQIKPQYKKLCMASVDTLEELELAQSKGWRTYFVNGEGLETVPNSIDCPHDSHGVQCAGCNLCSGLQSRAKSVAIEPHGTGQRFVRELAAKG